MAKIALGRLHASHSRAAALKFAIPIILVPELFATTDHLAALIGYLTTVGWEVYVPDMRGVLAGSGNPGFELALELIGQVPAALGCDVIVAGHGIGGLLALKLAERKGVRAAVAFAPLLPGFRTKLYMRARNLPALWLRRTLRPPSGALANELFADVDQFRRPRLIGAMVPEAAVMALEVARGKVRLTSEAALAPRLIIAGETDRFAPIAAMSALARSSGAHLVTFAGRGHWLVEGRALDHVVGEMQRFLVRELGKQLLLLYPGEDANLE
ncbi:MAG: alpha/beta hydrolase [Candidatus Binataceae bacterium]